MEKTVPPEERTNIMTAAAMLIEEGRQEGRQEGQILMQQQDVLEVLEIRYGTIPELIRNSIQKLADKVRLQELHRLAVQCKTMEEFSEDLK